MQPTTILGQPPIASVEELNRTGLRMDHVVLLNNRSEEIPPFEKHT